MSFWIIPVLLSTLLGPGAGQLHNKEYKKGVLLLIAGLVTGIMSSVYMGRNLMPYLSQDMASMDVMQLAELGDKMSSSISPTQSGFMLVCYVVITILWIYGIVDAYFGAKRRKAKEAAALLKSAQAASKLGGLK